MQTHDRTQCYVPVQAGAYTSFPISQILMTMVENDKLGPKVMAVLLLAIHIPDTDS